MSDQKFYVTTPIYYVNDKPHIGHAYTTILGDVLARYARQQGANTWFLTGSDEHGQKVQESAAKAGVTPQAQADATVVRFQDLWKRLEITHDDFIRTTEPRHKQVVAGILQDLFDRGEIYRAEYDGWYCVPCERFYMEKDLQAGQCPQCDRPVQRIREANYFFRMSRYQDWLIRYIEEHPRFIQPDYRRNETLGFLRKPLTDLCISRPKSRLAWGIDLPFDKDYVCYVWFDALVNYISAVGYRANDAAFNQWWPCSCHLIGKDILTTHTVYWPTMLKAMGLPMPETIFAHGWWLSGQTKMSKSLGNVVDPMAMVDRYGVDPFRYFLMAEMILGQDASFTEEAFVRRYNADLANDLGNALSRIVKLMGSHTGGRIPEPGKAPEDLPTLTGSVQTAVDKLVEGLKAMRVDQGLAAIIDAVRELNRFLERHQPWTLAKQGDLPRLGGVLYHAAEALRILSGCLHPVMPEKMTRLRAVLGVTDAPALTGQVWGGLTPGTPIGEMAILFPRIRLDEAVSGAVATAPAPIAPIPVSAATPVPVGLAMIAYDDFAKVQLRTAKVIVAERVKGADKLLRIEVDLGTERRQILAGIAQHYTPEAVLGKTVVIVANLQPRKLRGLESQGMLLAASQGETLRLVTIEGELAVGATVK